MLNHGLKINSKISQFGTLTSPLHYWKLRSVLLCIEKSPQTISFLLKPKAGTHCSPQVSLKLWDTYLWFPRAGKGLAVKFTYLFCSPFCLPGGGTKGPGSMCRGVAVSISIFGAMALLPAAALQLCRRLSRRFLSLESVLPHCLS